MTVKEVDELMQECFDPETGVLFDEKRYDDLKVIRAGIIEDKAMKIKRLKNDIIAYKAAKSAYEDLIKTSYKIIEKLKDELMFDLDGEGMTTDRVKVSFRSSDRVVVDDVYKLPEAYIRYKQPEARKDLLKKAISEGMAFDGVKLVANTSVVIK